jgi:MEMO1 family protein
MVRQPAVAGTFYPADATILRQTEKQLLRPSVASFETEPLKALIVPHAGYVYSGPVAGYAYAQLVAHAETVRRVVLLGPTHRAPVRGMALPEANAFATPLGEV